MVNKKGDISTTTIIMIAIGVFVLVLVIGFTTGFFGKLGGQIGDSGGGDIGTAKRSCNTLCSEAKAGLDTWTSSTYCGQLQNVGDTDGDGSADFVKCWEDPIGIVCSDKKVVGGNYVVYYVNADGACTTTADVAPDDVSTLDYYS